MKPLHTLNKNLKILLGVATVWPFIYMPIFFTLIFSLILNPPKDNSFPPQLWIIFPLHFFTIIMSLITLGLFIIDLFKNKSVEGDKKPLWALAIFFGSFIALPIYWYLHIWKYPKASKRN